VRGKRALPEPAWARSRPAPRGGRAVSARIAPLVLGALFAALPAAAEDWPQVQHDAGHTGYTPDQPSPPFRLRWVQDIGEPTQTATQPIVAEGKIYLTTGHGNIYALDRETGKRIWRTHLGAPLFASPAYWAGTVFVTSLDRRCYALSASDGRVRWRFATGEPIWAAPVVAEEKVFVGGRDGFVYALDAASGALLWKAPIGGLVMNTPAYCKGRLYVAAGDMRVYAYDARSGKLVWRSAKIPGAAMREYWVVATERAIVLTTQLVYACHPTQEMIQQAVMNPFNERHKNDPVLVEDEVFPELKRWYEKHPHQRTVFVLEPERGREKFTVPVIGVNGGSCTSPPPAVAPDGWAYTMYANVWLRASGWAFFGRFNLDTGAMEPLLRDRYAPKLAHPEQWHWQPRAGTQFTRRSTFDGGFSVSDQSWGVSLGGEIAFLVRDPGHKGTAPAHNMFHIPQRLDRYLIPDVSARHRLGAYGTYGSAYHSTCSPMVISDNDVFHKSVRSVLFAFEGS